MVAVSYHYFFSLKVRWHNPFCLAIVPSVKIQNGDKTFKTTDILDSQEFKNSDRSMIFYFGEGGFAVSGDIKLTCTSTTNFGVAKVFTCWVNTLFIVDGTIKLSQVELDGPHKDKKNKVWPNDLVVELQFAKTMEDAVLQSTETKTLVMDGPKPSRSLMGMLSPARNTLKAK